MNNFQQIFQRVEKKYILSEYQYESLRKYLNRVARVDQYGETQIRNIYYDTPDYALVRNSLASPVYKEKLRLRSYGEPGRDSTVFIEIKKKYSGIVYKRRVGMTYPATQDYLNSRLKEDGRKTENWGTGRCSLQILREIDYFFNRYQELQPEMVIYYNRIAMAGLQDPDFRITFDRNICFRTEDLNLSHGDCEQLILPKGQILMELKIAGAIDLQLSAELSRRKIFPVGFSKYGRAYQMLIQKNTKEQAAEIPSFDTRRVPALAAM